MNKCKSKSLFQKTCFFTNTALKKAQNFIELSQLNLRISGLKSRVERKCSLIGALIVSKKNGCVKNISGSQCDEKIDKLCCDVEKLRKKIIKAKNEINDIKRHMKNCSFCNDDCCDDDDVCDDDCFDDVCDEEDDDLNVDDSDKVNKNNEKTI